MKKGEMLYESLLDVKSDYVEQAENYNFKRKRSNAFMKWGIAAAACLALGLAVFGITRSFNTEPGEISASVPSARPTENAVIDTSAPTAEPTSRKVVYGEQELINNPENVINPGEVWILGTLPEEMDMEENADALFYVEIDMFGVAKERMGELRTQLLNALETAEYDPAFREFNESIYTWFNEVKAPTLTPDELSYFWNEMTSWDPYCYEFFGYVAEKISGEKADEFRAAKARYDAAKYEYDNYEVPQEVIAEFEAEIDRLMALGYNVEASTIDARAGSVCAYLAREQIESFAANPEYAYWIFFAGADICVPE